MKLREDFFQKSGFQQIRDILSGYCGSDMTKAQVQKLNAFESFAELDRALLEAKEALSLANGGKPLPGVEVTDIRRHLQLVAVEGSMLAGEELLEFRFFCRVWDRLHGLLHSKKGSLLAKRIELIDLPTGLAGPLELALDSEGQVTDQASPELGRLRQRINSTRTRARQVLSKALQAAKKSKQVAEDAELTVRNGRLAMPILAEHKRQVKGLQWGSSASGQTVFLEPEEAVALNNAVTDMEDEERRLILRILRELTARFRPHTEALRQAFPVLIHFDLLQAKAKLAKDWQADFPTVENKPSLKLREARHPLLLQKLGKTETVPFDLDLDEQGPLVLISGPNAGGKSATMTAVVLLQYMAQTGLPLPCGEESSLGFFSYFALNIGDSQSLESDLSTYSSHLQQMKELLQRVDKHSLVGLDEFGSGTEPNLGGALARAMLEKLLAKGCKGVITSHFAALKQFAHETEGLVNAGMRFDAEALKPTFQLQVGYPGSSYALEIAQSIGLGKELVNRARKLAGKQQASLEELLVRLEQAEGRAQELAEQSAREKGGLAKARQDYEELKAFVQKRQKEELRKAKDEGARIIEAANRKVEQTIKEIRESQAEKAKTQKLRQQLASEKDNLLPKGESKARKPSPLAVGDLVYLDQQGSAGEVLKLKAKEALVRFGQLTSFVKLSRLSKAKGEKAAKETVQSSRLSQTWSFRPQLDLRGKRAEEALGELERFVDRAMAANSSGTLRVLHGKGNGVLHDLTQNYLKDRREVATYADAHPESGGAGITEFSLK